MNVLKTEAPPKAHMAANTHFSCMQKLRFALHLFSCAPFPLPVNQKFFQNVVCSSESTEMQQ